MEENNDNLSQTSPALQSSEKQGSKQNNPFKIVTIICAILALAGIGFGVYEMLQVNKAKQEISDLRVEIKKDDGATTTIETDKIEVKEADKAITITDSTVENDSPYIKDGYFYVPFWGVKFKLTDELTQYGYSTHLTSKDEYYDEIGFTAMRKEDMPGGGQVQTWDDILTCTMVKISRLTQEQAHSVVTPTAVDIDFGDDYTFEIWKTANDRCIGATLNKQYTIDEATQIIIDKVLSHPENI